MPRGNTDILNFVCALFENTMPYKKNNNNKKNKKKQTEKHVKKTPCIHYYFLHILRFSRDELPVFAV